MSNVVLWKINLCNELGIGLAVEYVWQVDLQPASISEDYAIVLFLFSIVLVYEVNFVGIYFYLLCLLDVAKNASELPPCAIGLLAKCLKWCDLCVVMLVAVCGADA